MVGGLIFLWFIIVCFVYFWWVVRELLWECVFCVFCMMIFWWWGCIVLFVGLLKKGVVVLVWVCIVLFDVGLRMIVWGLGFSVLS